MESRCVQLVLSLIEQEAGEFLTECSLTHRHLNLTWNPLLSIVGPEATTTRGGCVVMTCPLEGGGSEYELLIYLAAPFFLSLPLS